MSYSLHTWSDSYTHEAMRNEVTAQSYIWKEYMKHIPVHNCLQLSGLFNSVLSHLQACAYMCMECGIPPFTPLPHPGIFPGLWSLVWWLWQWCTCLRTQHCLSPSPMTKLRVQRLWQWWENEEWWSSTVGEFKCMEVGHYREDYTCICLGQFMCM